MAKGIIRCNMCGKEFDNLDEDFKFGVHWRIGFGSQHDGDKVDLDLCPECFDKFIYKLRKKCKIDPIVECY
jgi:DNA-directed RNA polymerase subunit RPC12/RpoP